MKFLELLRLFRKLIDLPSFSNKAATADWLLVLCDAGALITGRTPTTIDDAALAFLRNAIGNPALFDSIHNLLVELLGANDDAGRVMAPPELVAEAERVGIDPFTIIAIVEAVVSLVKFFREWRNR